MRFTQLAVCLCSLAACKSNSAAPDATSDTNVDTSPPADAMIDAAPTPSGCDYGEQNDLGNDDTTAGVAEQTGLTFTTSSTLCGNFDRGHFNSNTGAVDVDAYKLAVAADADVLVSITGSGLAGLGDAEVVLLDGAGNEIDQVAFLGDHGIFGAHLPAGTYEVDVFATNGTELAAVVPYRVRIALDAPATRCPKVTAAATYTEALDTAGNDQAGNDVVEVRFNSTPARNLTASATDGPEPTGITIVPATSYRITGTAKLPAAASLDDYLERDTYLVKTGAATNQLAIRLSWPGTTADFDYLVFPEIATGTPAEIASSTDVHDGEDEFKTFSVLPNTNYWLWIAPFNTLPGTSSAALPITYDASICGETFIP